MSTRRWSVLLLAVGAHGAVVQIVLIRELMASFAGNELTAGLVLTVWLAAEAGGAWLLGRIARARHVPVLATVALLGTAAAVPLVALVRAATGALPGQSLSLPVTATVALAVVSLPGFLHGGLFATGTAGRAESDARPAGIGPGYVWEGAGSVVGATAAWFLLIPRIGPVATVAVAGLPVAGLLFGPGRRAVLAAATTVSLLAAAVGADRIERAVLSVQWAGQAVAGIENTAYGRILRLEREDQLTLVADGAPVLTLPMADPGFAEELAWIPAFARQGPVRRALVLGSHAAVAARLFEGCSAEVHLVRLDPDLAAAEAATGAVPDDPRFRLIVADPRRFLRDARDRFDLIIVTDAAPGNLAQNRLFTVEFFRLCRQRLGPRGVLALPGPGGVTGFGDETRTILAVRRRTLAAAFRSVCLLAADFPLFLASGEALILDAATLAGRIACRSPGGVVLDSAYARSLLEPFRQQGFLRAVTGDAGAFGARVNLDRTPSELFLNIVRENVQTAPSVGRLYARLAGLGGWHVLALGLAVLAVTLVLARARHPGRMLSVAVAGSGYAGAALTTAAILAYQVRFGSTYSAVALLVAAFMAGTVLGGRIAAGLRGRVRALVLGFAAGEVGMIAAATLLALLARPSAGMVFLALAVGGAGLGFQFPAAGQLVCGPSGRAEPAGRKAGRLAAADLLGGATGGLVTVLVLAPALGLGAALAAVAGLKAVTLLGFGLAFGSRN